MKKILIAAAIVCAAVVAQAATIWTLSGFDSAYNGYKVISIVSSPGTASSKPSTFVPASQEKIDEVTADGSEAFLSYFFDKSTTQSDTWQQHYAALKTLAPFCEISDGQAIVLDDSGRYYHHDVRYLVVAEDIAPGSRYTVLGTKVANFDADQSVTTDVSGFVMGADRFPSDDPVPEPASGLLLLLGVAGLALKRKQK